jgi:glutathione S-transferase
MARTLYQFPLSPFSRRARLALAHKRLEVELRDARANAAFLAQARERSPIKTIPILVEPDGRALGDSGAIAHYLDAAYTQGPALWPRGDAAGALAAFEIAALVDVALTTIVDVGTRYYELCGDAAWPRVKEEMVGRAQRALDGIAERLTACTAPTVIASGWSGADIWLFTAIAWLEALPTRARDTKNIAQIMTLGWKLPHQLPRWADAHRGRADVLALD